ncbi:MAG: hypothetical protein Harvfovirus30_4 [Harvfovirus sp.]|uniref:Prolyl 4-hydroxylase alpha subunit Fe(2+) 2OG dioxygenase domain-containing protein n=1 Tax=Harvfovirus sp. TaxID=2487768 RepID=A0A3G5A2E0_9VIRU|nr:MAG: hypothetical protein Harvfovirus30_4 [Harvfovirus sp.]
MSQFIKEYGIIDQTIEDKLFSLVKHHGSKFETSRLYSADREKKFIDIEKRSSQYRLITTKAAFDLVDSLINKINSFDKTSNYILFRNNITQISYATGDFFQAHEDYLSITSNMLEEYTMIICMDATCEGGETIFHVNDWFKHTSKSSITPGHCLLFRKDLKHEGAILKSGTKNILTLNVWRTKKSCESIVGITFPASDDPDQATPKYFISTNKIIETNTLLASFLRFSSNPQKIYIYEEKNYTSEDFEIIYKLYNEMYITAKEYTVHRNIIDYYQFTAANILIDLTEEIHKTIKSVKYTLKDKIIFCPTPELALHINETIKVAHLPYINFKMILAEGSLSYGGEMSGTPTTSLNMTPMWVTFSDHNNILFKSHFVTKRDPKFNIDKLDHTINIAEIVKEYDDNEDDTHHCGKVKLRDIDDDNENDDVDVDDNTAIIECSEIYAPTTYFGLQLCEVASPDQIFANIISEDDNFTYLPYHKPIDVHYEKEQSPYYDIDPNDKITITPKHYKGIIAAVKESKLLTITEEEIKNIKFLLPQVKHSYHKFFCNEDVYGNANFLTVYGFLRLDE